jgi:parallel beta-helix repeat protein
VIVFDGANNSISANTVAFNDLHGVAIIADSSKGNPITGNSLFSNGLLGIDLRGGTENAADATANDPGDTDAGPNGLQNKPVITAAKTVSGKTTIKGTLNSASNKVFNVQLFSNPSGNEGKKFIGQTAVTTDASDNASFTFTPTTAMAVGQTIKATATDSVASNTFEFSAPRKVVAS